MKNDKRGHQLGRNARSFEAHSRNRGSSEVRQGRAWRFAKGDLDFFEPHYRVTSRMAALPGNHVRRVQEPVRAPHGK